MGLRFVEDPRLCLGSTSAAEIVSPTTGAVGKAASAAQHHSREPAQLAGQQHRRMPAPYPRPEPQRRAESQASNYPAPPAKVPDRMAGTPNGFLRTAADDASPARRTALRMRTPNNEARK